MFCAETPSTTGMKKAVAAVLLTKAERAATETMMTARSTFGFFPARLTI